MTGNFGNSKFGSTADSAGLHLQPVGKVCHWLCQCILCRVDRVISARAEPVEPQAPISTGRLTRCRNRERDGRALAFGGLDFDCPRVSLDDAVDDAQAEARATLIDARCEKRIEGPQADFL